MYENTCASSKLPEVYLALDKLDKMMAALSEAVADIDGRTGFARLPVPQHPLEEMICTPSHRSSLSERIYNAHDVANALRNRLNQIIEELEI